MTRTLKAWAASLAVSGLMMATPAVAQNAETEAVLSDMADTFARGFYARDPQMVLSVVHPELSKIGVTHNFNRSGEDIIEQLPPGTLRVLGRVYNANGRLDPVTSTVETVFYDSTANVGVFMLLADREWYDIFVGARINGEWVLVNCAYAGQNQLENANEAADRETVHAVVSDYARGWDEGDYDAIIGAMYPDADRRHVVRGGREYLMPETLEMIEVATERHTAVSETASVTVFDVTNITAAARIDAHDRTEWVLLQRIDDRWQIVNSLWEARS